MSATTIDKNANAVLCAFAATDSLAGDSLPIGRIVFYCSSRGLRAEAVADRIDAAKTLGWLENAATSQSDSQMPVLMR
jgi:hypothetical protein